MKYTYLYISYSPILHEPLGLKQSSSPTQHPYELTPPSKSNYTYIILAPVPKAKTYRRTASTKNKKNKYLKTKQ